MLSNPDIPTVSNSEAQQRVAEGAQLLDVRENDEFQHDHAKGATHCPLLDVLEEAKQVVDSAQQVLVICKSGARSARAVQALREMGWDAVNVEGGTDEWRASGGPMVTDLLVRHVSAQKAQQLLAEGLTAIDVRSPEQFAAGHAEGAVNIPFDEDATALQEKYPADQPLLLLCNTGGRAGRAAAKLSAAGWTPIVVAGGTKAWKASGGKISAATN